MAEQKGRKPVLGDHKRVGKRLIPRMAELKMQEQSWGQRTLPELIWIALLENYFPGGPAANLTIALARAAHEVNAPKWFVTAGGFTGLSLEQKAAIVAKLQATGELHYFRQAFNDFAYLYPEFPLQFLFDGEAREPGDKEAFLNKFKGTLQTLFDKRGREAVFIQAYAIQAGFAIGKFKVQQGSALANLAELDNYPDTDKALMVGAGVCAAINMIARMGGDNDTAWPDYFWNRGLELAPCELDG